MCDLARPAESIVTKSVTLGELTRYGTKNYDRRVNRERREQPLPAFRVFRLASMDLRLERWVGRTLGFERDFSGTESNPQASARAAKLSRIVTCTVIRSGDMANAILDRDRHPEWNGQQTKLVYAFPSDEALWKRYAKVRAERLRRGHSGEEATVFYRENRAAMDVGAVVAWPERFNHDVLSAA